MSNNWSYGFLVSPSQNRAQRFIDATTNNPTITATTRPEAEAARDEAFQFVDNNAIVAPYQILASGHFDDDNEVWTHVVQVHQEPTEES